MANYLENPLPVIQDAKHNEHTIKLGFTHHATAVRMIERGITRKDIETALDCEQVRIVRNHNGDKSPSCRVLGWDESGRPLQIVVAYKVMLVVTVYTADDDEFLRTTEGEGHE